MWDFVCHFILPFMVGGLVGFVIAALLSASSDKSKE